MQPPSQQELDDAAAAFDEDWGAVDEVLYEFCHAHPGHASRREVSAKIALIDRTYAAGAERCVTPAKGQQALTIIAEKVMANGPLIDDIVSRLALVREPLSAVSMSEIVAAHGRLTALLKVVTGKRTPRSFAAKYLHFHCPRVPIYDSYTASGLVRLVRWDEQTIPFARPAEGDAEYWEFCVRFLRLHDACRAAGLRLSVKNLDSYLWQASFTP
jgi:hypothetical protein